MTSQIEHSRHRSPINFLVSLVAGLLAYLLSPAPKALNRPRLQLAAYCLTVTDVKNKK